MSSEFSGLFHRNKDECVKWFQQTESVFKCESELRIQVRAHVHYSSKFWKIMLTRKWLTQQAARITLMDECWTPPNNSNASLENNKQFPQSSPVAVQRSQLTFPVNTFPFAPSLLWIFGRLHVFQLLFLLLASVFFSVLTSVRSDFHTCVRPLSSFFNVIGHCSLGSLR